MAISQQGAILARIKADTGLPWQAIAESIGASSGDYVRKVASGAKPGNNLATNLARIMETGKVDAPVPRRTTKSGQVARVRAAAGGERRPSQQPVRDGGRRMHRAPNGRMGWAQPTGDARSGTAFTDTVRKAAQGRRRVKIRVKVRDPRGGTRWVEVGGKGGYAGRDILAGVRAAGGDVGAWLEGQTSSRSYGGAINANTIADIEVIAE